MVTGLDLVEWQLRVAAGERLPATQDEIKLNGHAFEARLYAEDAAKGFLPATGTLHHLKFPDTAPDGTSLRIETGVRAGDSISPFYDPMITKLVAHGPDRKAALSALGEALAATEIAGSTVNTAFLAALAADKDFAAGDIDTGLIARHQEALTAPPPPPTPRIVAAAMLAASGIDERPVSDDPWSSLAGYAHFHAVPKRIELRFGEQEIAATAGIENGKWSVAIPPTLSSPHKGEGKSETLTPPSRLLGGVRTGGVPSPRLATWPGHVTVFDGAASYTFAVPDPLERANDNAAGLNSLRAPMPGLVKLVRALKGEAVAKGQPLLILEAMKMEHTIAAPHDGIIAEIAAEGAQVSDGAVLVKFAEEAG
jgi:3-methylcrotonyl-CoA carboxylase alpha subunit